ncbi:Panacea domain-containing protein [Thomasclavelia sp.]
MCEHVIVISSSYKFGSRVALHYVQDENMSFKDINKDLIKIRDICGDDIQLAIHKISTKDRSWNSVVKKDSFFEGITLFDKLDTFISVLSIDRILKPIDVAKFILSIKPYTHLGIQKMVYLCYADYLCKSGKKMFNDTFYAYSYGPVASSLYKMFKKYERNEIRDLDNEDKIKIDDNTEISACLARVIFSKDGVEVGNSLIESLKKYLDYTPSQLVSITHRSGSPWYMIYDENKYNQVISDELIKKYHYIETL